MDDDHGAGANIFWGSDCGCGYDCRDWIQIFGLHFGVRRDVGNIYYRRLEVEYWPTPLKLPPSKIATAISWRTEISHGTNIQFQIRSVPSEKQLFNAVWIGPDQADANSHFDEPDDFTLPAEAIWLQYRVLLLTPNGRSTPVLDEVWIYTIQI